MQKTPEKNILNLLISIISIFMCFYEKLEASPVNNKEHAQIKDTTQPDSLKDVVKITRTWELPSTLKKISGIDYLDAEHLVCIQDEVGSIYIYNLNSKTIESEIPFGPPGDYEGIALVNDNAYVSCADGRLYEIANYRSGKPAVKEYGTHLTVKQNVEGLCYDKKNNRLLVVIKGSDEGNKFFKGIYSFDLNTHKMAVKPAIRIDLQDSVFSRQQSKKLQSVLQPSDIRINPLTQEIYIVDGPRSQLLIMDESGNIKRLYPLNKAEFVQPEGVTFTPSGELYIASEGIKMEPGMLMLLELK